MNLVLYWMEDLKAYIDEVRTNSHNCNPVIPPYSQYQIYRAELQLGLFQKAASSTSDLVYSPTNLFKNHYKYWNQSFPAGIVGESIRDLIGIDERGYMVYAQLSEPLLW